MSLFLGFVHMFSACYGPVCSSVAESMSYSFFVDLIVKKLLRH